MLLLEEGSRRIVEVEDSSIVLAEVWSIGLVEGRHIVKEELRIEELVGEGFGMKGSQSFVAGVGSRCCSLRTVAARNHVDCLLVGVAYHLSSTLRTCCLTC